MKMRYRTNDTLSNATNYASRHQYELGHDLGQTAVQDTRVDSDGAGGKFCQ